MLCVTVTSHMLVFTCTTCLPSCTDWHGWRPQDCEFTYLSTQVLHLLGIEGPRTKEPAKYIRYIYNRVILENATVRAAAVSSLAQFGALVEELRPRVQVLLKRALHDNDDEVTVQASWLLCFALLV